MSGSTLFVCQSCSTSDSQSSEFSVRLSVGKMLLDRLSSLHQTWSRRSQLEVQAVHCLWTCDHPCAVALSSSQKSTYVLANIPVTEDAVGEAAKALLHLSEHYLDSQDGSIPWKQFPDILQTNIVARIPLSEHQA